MPIISVIIPYKHSVDILHKCLQSIEQQTIIPDTVVCICNYSSFCIPQYSYTFNVKFIHESNIGSYVCRNTGIRYIQADYYFFIDSDCILSPKYIENMLQYCQEDRILSGHIELIHSGTSPNIYEWYDRLFYLDQEDYAKKGFGATASLVVPSKIFKEIGLFSDMISGGDLEFGLRAKKYNYKTMYIRDAIIYHPSRNTFNALFSKTKRIKNGYIPSQKLRNSYINNIQSIYIKKKRFNIPLMYIFTSLILHKLMMSILFVQKHLQQYISYNTFEYNSLEEYM